MGPDPFNMPGFGSQSAAQNSQALRGAVAQAAPLAPQWHGVQSGPAPQQVFNQPAAPKSQGVISSFTHFIGGIGSDVGHIASGAASWLGQNLKSMAIAPVHFVQGIDHVVMDNSAINQTMAWTKQSSDRLDALTNQYKSGRISKTQYQSGLNDIANFQKQISQRQTAVQNRIAADKQTFTQAAIGTEAGVITIMTAGLGRVAAVGAEALPVGERAAATFLASHAPDEFLTSVEQGINKLATDPALFSRLEPAAQKAIQAATAEVVAQSTSMTAKQVARTAAVNLAFKYPIYYNMLNGQGQEIYAKLDNKQYGSAVQQMALNAALLLAGGPIGWALKQGGKGFGALGGAIFGESSFIDELSKGIGNGDSAGLAKAINKIDDPAIKQEVVQNLSAVEATNRGAVQGGDSVAAAWRVLNGMASYEGISMSSFTHEEALTNMVNFAKAQRLVDEVGKANNLGPITVGRLDARALEQIANNLTSGSRFADAGGSFVKNADGIEVWTPNPTGQGGNATAETRLQLWDALKAGNPTQAWANNGNFDKQIEALINKHPDAPGLEKAIKGISASFNVKGFPEAEAKQLSKMGYIPIKPVNLEAPFQEGTGKLVTGATNAGDQNPDFFLKAVKPLPVLDSIGSLLTNLGLSPTAATGRVYALFNEGLASNITKLDGLSKFADKGETDLATADNLIKRLSNYAHNPQTFAQKAFPITDLRQMTTGDIMKALPELSKSDAQDVKGAIMDAMLQVPLKVRGLGDKIVDTAYKIIPFQRSYLRIQGGARFAWNPFFQAKLAYKTELLTQAEAGGHFPTMLGTNKVLSVIFPDKYNQLDNIASSLRANGMFDKKAALGESLTGEAVNDTATGANLTHKLLPSQERSISALIAVQADRVNMSVDDFIKYNTQDVRDTIQTIAQYDRRSPFLNSAMARTLNLAFFPFRFELKVATIMAKSLAQTSPMTQLAVINGLYRAHDWLNSKEGMAWYSQNSQVIGLIKYFTPLQTLGEVSNILGMKVDSIGSLGELGGLPFGWIPQMLDAQGLTNFGGAYVSPTTGQTLPSYIPATDKGKLAAGIQDLLGQLYTYPGVSAGLPSKTKIDSNIALGIARASKTTDFTKVTPPVPASQMNFSQAVQQANAQRIQQQGGLQVPKNQTNVPQVPGQLRPVTQVPAQTINTPGKTSTSSSKTKIKKLKKAQFTPQLLPGQSNPGQVF